MLLHLAKSTLILRLFALYIGQRPNYLKEVMEIGDVISSVLKRHHEVKLAILFGSFAHGRATQSSDVDLAIASSPPLTLEKRVEIANEVAHHVRREVDLIDLHQASGVLLEQVLSHGKLLLVSDRTLYASFIKKMWLNGADFGPLIQQILNERRKRFLNG